MKKMLFVFWLTFLGSPVCSALTSTSDPLQAFAATSLPASANISVNPGGVRPPAGNERLSL